MGDIGWCNHLTVTRGVCETCGERVSGLTIEPLVIGLDPARENAALRKEVEDLKRNPRYVEVAALCKKVEACEAEHPPEREYVEWCEAGKPDVTALRKRVEELECENFAVRTRAKGWRIRAEKAEENTARLSLCVDALRERAEKAEQSEEFAIERAEKAERERDSYRRDFDGTAKVYELLRAEFNALLARAEKAERERDETQARCDEDRAEWVKDMKRVREINSALQADLDAALLLCIEADWDVKVLGSGYEPAVYEAHARILALLEKRSEQRG